MNWPAQSAEFRHLNDHYDPAERMLRLPFSTPGYCTQLQTDYAHPIRESLRYAVALLDTGDDAARQRAEDILERILPLQDVDEASRTYGLWSWFMEEPLERMKPPDENWADFCGTQLLQVSLDHRGRIAPALAGRVDAAIAHAARAIQRRDVGLHYTNIVAMGTYVTLVAGQHLGHRDLFDYARARLEAWAELTLDEGSFTEYNSPTYTMVTVRELARILQHGADGQVRRTAGRLYRLAWEEVAEHFHPPTQQWAGPHSRCYSTLLTADRRPHAEHPLALIERATEGRVQFGPEPLPQPVDAQRPPLRCPADLEARFVSLREPRQVVKTVVRHEPRLVTTTWLSPRLALGTVSRADMWTQKRPLLAYWGSAAQPGYFRVRCLRDGRDLAAADLHCVQDRGRALAAITFFTDGGMFHPFLECMTDGVMTAEDFRVRLAFGGDLSGVEIGPPSPDRRALAARLGELSLRIGIPFARFGSAELVLSDPQEARDECGPTRCVDLVIHSGPRRSFRLAEHAPAAIALAIEFDGSSPPAVRSTHREDQLSLAWDGLSLSVKTRPEAGAIVPWHQRPGSREYRAAGGSAAPPRGRGR